MENKTLIYDGAGSRIYLLENSEFGPKVVLKEQKLTSGTVSKRIHIYESLKKNQIPGIASVINYSQNAVSEPYLILNYANGESLWQHIQHGVFSLDDFFTLALDLCGALSQLHHLGILHKDLSPNNIIWDSETKTTTLIDFDCAASIKQTTRNTGNFSRLEGTLAYLSPEQTGRINREVDFRSDLYSLGATFYHMLCGKPPFDFDDPAAIVYAQIAKVPAPLSTINPQVPKVLERVVLKLLEKEAAKRYQSAEGLKNDLEFIRTHLSDPKSSKALVDMVLGTRDFSDTLQFSQKLYGRTLEIEQLQKQLELVRNGATRLVFIEGASGTGKSVLVNELNKIFLEYDCYFIKGKFDQYRRETPYLAWIQVFENFISQILSQSNTELDRWKKIFIDALGENAQVLADLIPSLHLVTGDLPVAEKLSGSEAQNRFNYLVEAFIIALCRPENPLIIFLDDLQWADSASQQILQLLLGNPGLKHLLLIMATRPVEEGIGNSLLHHITKASDQYAKPLHLELSDLKEAEITAWLQDTLNPCQDITIAKLSSLIYAKTLGNAFFTKRFIQSLYDQGLVYFDRHSEKWIIQEAEIGKMQMTDNVVEFMTQKISELDPSSINALKKAAVIGNEFDQELLQYLLGESTHLDYVLQSPLREGYLEMLPQSPSNRYIFVHDRIYQAVNEMNDAIEKEKTHYEIAVQLLKHIPESSWYDQAFLLASHLNQARQLLQTVDQREALIRINLLAGRRAKTANAYAQGIQFLETGLSQVTQDGPSDVELKFAFLCELLETNFLDGQFAQGEQCLSKLKALSLNRAQQLQALQLEIRFHKSKIDYPASIRTGIEALKILGEKLPQKAGQLDILRSFMSAQLSLRKKSTQVLQNLPLIQNEDKLMALQILSELGLAAYQSNQNLLPIMTLKAVQLSATYGNAQYSPSDYNVYGFILGQMGNFRSMKDFALMSKQLVDQLEINKSMRAKHLMTYNGLTRHWFEHPSNALPSLLQAHQLGKESGDLDVVVTSLLLYFDSAFFYNHPLDELAEFVQSSHQLCIRLGQKLGTTYFSWVASLLDAFRENDSSIAFSFDSEEAAFIQMNDSNGLCKIAVFKSLFHYLKGQYQEAFHLIQKINKYPLSLGGLHISAWLPFLQGLIATEVLSDSPGNKSALREFKNAHKKLKQYNAFYPQNFEHRKLSLDAVEKLNSGQKLEAIQLLKQASSKAALNKFSFDQALIACKIARLYQHLEEEESANSWAKSAYHFYENLQFKGVIQVLEKQFSIGAYSKEGTSSSHHTHSADGSSLDLNTVIKTLQTISAEVIFDKLVQNLLHFVAENAGAEKGALFLDKNPEWLASHNPNSLILRLLPIESIDEQTQNLATHIVQYCLRTGESIILDTAYQNEQFAADPYIQVQRPNSLLCIPLKSQGKVNGLLYLENSLVEGAFKNERSELLTLLASQLAISIENAFLYENLEHLIQVRTQQLETEKQQSERLLLNILPLEIANELKAKGSAEATQYEGVSVLFTDFVNFTQVSEQLSPKELIDKLDTCFRAFDDIIESNGLEKIKTVGDAYIAVCGLPLSDPEHAMKTVQAAKEIQHFIKDFSQKESIFEVRIGVHSGPVVAGIVGSKKFQYDIWGDTVNTAARMEQHSDRGKINVSQATFELIQSRFACTHRGKISAKNKGEIDMYFVD